MALTLAIAAAALAGEAIIGYPATLYRRIGHPVTWVGAAVAALDRGLNRDHWPPPRRRLAGVAALLLLLAATGTIAAAIAAICRSVPGGWLVEAAFATSLLAQRSLYQHVLAVAQALGEGGLAAGRRAVSAIVGRDPDSLDEAGVCRAAIESLAENFSDGVVAPAVWLAVAGLPGIALYKAINTADSMIGHRTPRHDAFGWAAARLDDLVNLPASRLAACLILAAAAFLSAGRIGPAARAVWRDAGRHRSPNAGWPEAAMAGALGLRLAGPRVYGKVRVEDAWMGDGRSAATAADIRKALRLYVAAGTGLWLVVASLAVALTVASA